MKKFLLFLTVFILSGLCAYGQVSDEELQLIDQTYHKNYKENMKHLIDLENAYKASSDEDEKTTLIKDIGLHKSTIRLYINTSFKIFNDGYEKKVSEIKYTLKDMEYDSRLTDDEKKAKKIELQNLMSEKEKEKIVKSEEYENLLKKYE